MVQYPHSLPRRPCFHVSRTTAVRVPYPFQEEAILVWFSSEQGVLVCAPTGMGKTLISLTEQKYREIQTALERWGYSKHYVGLVTGNCPIDFQFTL